MRMAFGGARTGLLIAVLSVFLLTSVVPGTAGPGERAPQTPAADYRFGNSFKSSAGTNRTLQEVGRGPGAFTKATVSGRLVTVFEFAKGGGLDLVNASDVIEPGEYTIVIVAKLSDVSSYRRLVNFKGNSSDTGLYVQNGRLRFYTDAIGPNVVFAADQWAQIALTRRADGRTRGYVDGVQQFEFMDVDNRAVIGSADILRFFRDNTNREESAGQVARILLYDTELTPTAISKIKWLPPKHRITLDIDGDTMTVTGRNFGPTEEVRVRFKPPGGSFSNVGIVTSTRAGAFTFQFQLAGGIPIGDSTVKTVGLTTGLKRSVMVSYT